MIKENQGKLELLRGNAKRLYVIADFDNTITAKQCRTSMGIINHSGAFEKGFEEEHRQICNQYKIKAMEATEDEIRNEMWNKTLYGFFELLQKYHLTEDKLEEILQKSNIKFREGFLDFIEFLHQKEIPLIIISAGVANLIEKFLEKEGVFYDNITIVSNDILFDAQGNIKEIPQNVINPVNKNQVSFAKEIEQKLKEKEYILLFGDRPDDIQMIEGREPKKTCSIAFANKQEEIEALKNKFDMVTDDSKILEMLKEILNRGEGK